MHWQVIGPGGLSVRLITDEEFRVVEPIPPELEWLRHERQPVDIRYSLSRFRKRKVELEFVGFR